MEYHRLHGSKVEIIQVCVTGWCFLPIKRFASHCISSSMSWITLSCSATLCRNFLRIPAVPLLHPIQFDGDGEVGLTSVSKPCQGIERIAQSQSWQWRIKSKLMTKRTKRPIWCITLKLSKMNRPLYTGSVSWKPLLCQVDWQITQPSLVRVLWHRVHAGGESLCSQSGGVSDCQEPCPGVVVRGELDRPISWLVNWTQWGRSTTPHCSGPQLPGLRQLPHRGWTTLETVRSRTDPKQGWGAPTRVQGQHSFHQLHVVILTPLPKQTD